MKKIICDRCGAEITYNVYFKVNVDMGNTNFSSGFARYEEKEYCMECMGKIMDVMEEK